MADFSKQSDYTLISEISLNACEGCCFNNEFCDKPEYFKACNEFIYVVSLKSKLKKL